MLELDAKGVYYRDLNALLRQYLADGVSEIRLLNVNGQRYIAAGVQAKAKLEIHGVPGNDLACFMDGPEITVWGNAQDAIGNTMNEGKVVVHGHAGDVLGYGMRSGKLFIRDDVGYRVGIHMKQYQDKIPIIVVGGTAGDFLGEYMAGGILIVLGLNQRDGLQIIGDYCATGIHGGQIFIRGHVDSSRISEAARIREASEQEMETIKPLIEEFCAHFSVDPDHVLSAPFTHLTPLSHNPYEVKYSR